MSRRPAPRTVELLKAARARIADPRRWTRGWLADTGGVRWIPGGMVQVLGRVPTAPDARRWCAMGAVLRESADRGIRRDAAVRRLRQAARDAGFAKVSLLNDDGPGHAAVLAMFDEAIGEK